MEVKIQKQRNVCICLLQTYLLIAKKDCYENIDISNITGYKKFWKAIFGSKIKSRNDISLVEGRKILQEEGLAQIFSDFFVSIVRNLWINEYLLPTSSPETQNVEYIIAKFENHPSIVTNVIDLTEKAHPPLKKLIKSR